jgi:hypothetical protein
MANTYQGYSGSDWARSAATTLADHIKEVEKASMRNFQFLAVLDSQGRISYGHSGRGFDWPVKYRNHRLTGNTGNTARNFAAFNDKLIANLPLRRGYQATDSISEGEMLENRGEAAIVNVTENMVSNLTESMKQGLASEPYVDGNATGNETSWHGLESFFSCNGTVKIDDGTQRSANAADKVGYPNDSYAGLTCGLGDYGGDQDSTATWPLGVADAAYDFWAPLVVNTTSTAFSPATHTFAGQGDEVMRYAIIQGQRNSSLDGQMTNFILERSMYNDLLNLIDNKEQIQIRRGEGLLLTSLGFKNVVSFDGVEVSWEAAVPAGVGYGFNYNLIELRCMYDSLLASEGPTYDTFTQTYNTVMKTLGNMKCKSPRNFVKLAALA